MITIFAIPKPFEGHIAIIQRNAIKSWTLLKPKPEIFLFGNEKGIKEAAKEFGIYHISEMARNEFGTPLISSVFVKAQEISKNDILVYVNTDIILMDNFMDAVKKIQNERSFLMIGQRIDFNSNKRINFKDLNWQSELQKEVFKEGKLHSQTGIDYFVFRKNFYKQIPSFALRTVWDEWLLYNAWQKKAKIIDATDIVMAVHQNHSYGDKTAKEIWGSKEAKKNLKLAGGYSHCFTIKDATHVLTSQELRSVPKMSLIRRLEIIPYLGFFIRQIKKIMKVF